MKAKKGIERMWYGEHKGWREEEMEGMKKMHVGRWIECRGTGNSRKGEKRR